MASNEQEGHIAGTGTPAGGGHGETTFPPFDPVNFTPMLIWLSLSFGLFYLLMSKIALPRVESILHARAHKITKDIGEANAFRARSEKAAAAHDKTIADAKAKALALAQETHARLTAETEINRLALEAELNARLAASRRSLARWRRRSFSTSPANRPTQRPLQGRSQRAKPDAGEFRCSMRSLS